jgi:hypothetical protein
MDGPDRDPNIGRVLRAAANPKLRRVSIKE